MSSSRDPRLLAYQRAVAIRTVIGARLRDERSRQRRSLADVAKLAGVSRAAVAAVETGEGASLEMIVGVPRGPRLGDEMDLVDRLRRERVTQRQKDPIHAAMGEYE